MKKKKLPKKIIKLTMDETRNMELFTNCDAEQLTSLMCAAMVLFASNSTDPQTYFDYMNESIELVQDSFIEGKTDFNIQQKGKKNNGN